MDVPPSHNSFWNFEPFIAGLWNGLLNTYFPFTLKSGQASFLILPNAPARFQITKDLTGSTITWLITKVDLSVGNCKSGEKISLNDFNPISTLNQESRTVENELKQGRSPPFRTSRSTVSTTRWPADDQDLSHAHVGTADGEISTSFPPPSSSRPPVSGRQIDLNDFTEEDWDEDTGDERSRSNSTLSLSSQEHKVQASDRAQGREIDEIEDTGDDELRLDDGDYSPVLDDTSIDLPKPAGPIDLKQIDPDRVVKSAQGIAKINKHCSTRSIPLVDGVERMNFKVSTEKDRDVLRTRHENIEAMQDTYLVVRCRSAAAEQDLTRIEEGLEEWLRNDTHSAQNVWVIAVSGFIAHFYLWTAGARHLVRLVWSETQPSTFALRPAASITPCLACAKNLCQANELYSVREILEYMAYNKPSALAIGQGFASG